MNWRKSVLLKKALRYGYDTIRKPYGQFCAEGAFHTNPPVLVNSFPKSGTHLLFQILQAIPRIHDWGLFLATVPSFTFREIPLVRMEKKIRGIVPGELVGAHLCYSGKISSALKQKRAVHCFIYRDPRDVAISEAYYLTYMNRWHRLSKYFRSLPDMEAGITFSITGADNSNCPYNYPDIGKRFRRYFPWVHNNDVYSLRYEDLNGLKREQIVREIIQFYLERSNQDLNEKEYIKRALKNINPENSHTFRKGRSGGWKNEFTKKQRVLFKDIAGSLLIDLGYEKNHDW